MAEEPKQRKSVAELTQEIAHSRDRLARDLAGLRYELDFPLKIRKSVQRNTTAWIGSAAALGVVAIMLPARTKKVYIKTKKGEPEDAKKGVLQAGLGLGVLKVIMDFARPAITAFVTRKLTGFAPNNGGPRK